MSDVKMQVEAGEQVIDGLTVSQWAAVNRTMSTDEGWACVASVLSNDVKTANETLFNSQEPERQNALHEAIGFLKFANRLTEIRDRARYVSERGVSPDAAIPRPPL